MKTKIYLNNEQFIAGITLKDSNEPEYNNMALHVCRNEQSIIQNRLKLAATLDFKLSNFVCANQTHSDNFYRVTTSDRGRGAQNLQSNIPNTDALYTFETNTVLCSFSADCVPVIFYNKQNGLCGVIHSGWQGTVQEVTKKTLLHCINEEYSNPVDFHIFIGPALSQEKFEVDEDVYIKFKNLQYADNFIYYNELTKKYHIDNQQIVKMQCEILGIPSHQITVDQTCTFFHEDGFSYRQNKQCGRHLAFIMKK